jgi:hypothetical protein
MERNVCNGCALSSARLAPLITVLLLRARNDALTLCAAICQLKQNAPPLLRALSHLLYCLILNHSPYACPHYFLHTFSKFRVFLLLPPSRFFLFLSVSVSMSHYRLFHLSMPSSTSLQASDLFRQVHFASIKNALSHIT